MTKFRFIDNWNSPADIINNPLDFQRKVDGRSTYTYKNGELILKKTLRKTDFITETTKSLFRNSNFITLDIETRTLEDGTMVPYCVCMCIPSTFEQNQFKIPELRQVSFYLEDFEDYDHMLKEAIIYLMKPKYSGFKIFIHNFSYFDGIFFMKIITALSHKIRPIIRDSQIIELKTYFGKNDMYSISFRDSFLLLPSSLKSLCQTFNVPQKKTLFPYNFSNKVVLKYKGTIPKITEFPKNVTPEEYDNYSKQWAKGEAWSLRDETIKYCINDCVSLYQILSRFSLEIFQSYDYDLMKSPTLPSLDLGIFRSNFLDTSKMKLPSITGNTYNDLVKGYTGGHVDVYIPISSEGEKVFQYDINSLYPYAMVDKAMPVGHPTYFEGNIINIDPSAFGFFYCKIHAPIDINNPILLTKAENGSTRAPVGTW